MGSAAALQTCCSHDLHRIPRRNRRNALFPCNPMKLPLDSDIPFRKVTLVDELQAPDGEPGYAVEVFNALGETLDVHMLPATSLEPASEDEILCVRRVESAA